MNGTPDLEGDEDRVDPVVHGAEDDSRSRELLPLADRARLADELVERYREEVEGDPRAAFIASLQDGFEMLDRDGAIIDVNERFAEIVGLPRERIIGLRPPFPWWPAVGRDRAEIEYAMASVIRHGSGEFDLTFRRPDGRAVHVILNANEVHGSVDDRIGIVAIVKDVSERFAAEAERKELLQGLTAEQKQLRFVLERLSRLQRVSDAALEWLDSDDALHPLLRRIREALGADSASLLVKDGELLRVRASDGLERIVEDQVPIPIGKGFAGRIAAERDALAADDVSKIDVVSPWLREHLRSVAGVPIVHANEVVGVLHVGSVVPRRFDRDDIELLDLVAARVGGALERARLFESARAARADASRSADRLRRLQTATAALTGAMTVREVTETILRQAVAAIQADAGVLAVPSADGRYLDLVATRGRLVMRRDVPARFPVDHDAAICEAYRAGASVWVPTWKTWERRFPGGLDATRSWARSVLAVPLRIDEQTLGSIGLMFKTEDRLSREERRLAKTFAEQAALALERARLFEAERDARDTTERLQALAASLAVAATPKDVLSVLVEDGSRIVEATGAWAGLVHDATQELEVIAAWRHEPDAVDGSMRMSLDLPTAPCETARLGRELWLTPETSAAGSDATAFLPMFDAVRHVTGIASFRFGQRHAIDERKKAAVRAIVSLGSQSLERAQLYELEHTIAATLQESLLPGELPSDRRVAIAGRYLPATQGLAVGGDWYDVIQISDDRIGLAVGDVVGHGIEAASAMGQLRSALRGLALAGRGPRSVVDGLDLFARTTAPTMLATIAYAELDLGTRALTYVCAGHPPPVVEHAGTVRLLEAGRTTPLAALPEPIPYEEGRETLPSGAALVLYSDGLIERRGEQLDVGMTRLMRALRKARSKDPEELADHVLSALITGAVQDDDVAVLCLRTSASVPPFSASFPAEASVLAEIRERVRGWLGSAALTGELQDEIVIACNEACANAIEHAYVGTTPEPITVELRLDADVVVVRVIDRGTWWNEPNDEDRGRGISIMGALMDIVDIRSDAGTQVTMERSLRRGSARMHGG